EAPSLNRLGSSQGAEAPLLHRISSGAGPTEPLCGRRSDRSPVLALAHLPTAVFCARDVLRQDPRGCRRERLTSGDSRRRFMTHLPEGRTVPMRIRTSAVCHAAGLECKPCRVSIAVWGWIPRKRTT